MSIELLTLKDWLLAPVYLVILVWITKYWANTYYADTPIKKYILPALGIKILGCVASILYHQYVYKGGDAFMYFETGLTINALFWHEPLEVLDIIFSPASQFTPKQWSLLGLNASSLPFLYETNALMCKIGGILSLLTFQSYVCISLLTAYVSFLGGWKLFLVFKDVYPQLEKEVALCMLFIPSVSFWGGGGLQKETILVASLGFFIYAFYAIFIKKQFNISLFLALIMGFAFLAIVRTFTAMVLIPALLVWVILYDYKRLEKGYKSMGFIVVLGVIGFTTVYLISHNSTKYNFNHIMVSLFQYQEGNAYMSKVTNAQRYDLGVVEHSLVGIIKTIPLCIITALYRPSLLDVQNYRYLYIGLENLGLLLLSIVCVWHIIQRKIRVTLRVLCRPEIAFCLLFSLSILGIVGFTTINFGGLVRCRISALPFFTFALLAISRATRQNAALV